MHCTATCDTCGRQTTVEPESPTFAAAVFALPDPWQWYAGLVFCSPGCRDRHFLGVGEHLHGEAA